MKINKRSFRQLQNLSKICSFDTENGVATVPLHYQNAEELLDPHLSRPDLPVISDETVDYLLSVTADIPESFSVEFTLTVDDCGEYTETQLLEAIQLTVENTYYYHDEKKRQDNVLGAFFLIIGFLALTVETLGGLAGWLGGKGTVVRLIVETLLDVIIWVFLWEGCAILLLTYENESTFFGRQLQRLNKMSIQNAGGQDRFSLDSREFSKGWVMLGKKEAFARAFILISNIIFLASLIWQIFGLLTSMESEPAMSIILCIVECILIILLVISNISFYLDTGSMKKYALPISVIVLLFNVAAIFYYRNSYADGVAEWVFSGIYVVGLILNILCLRYMKKQSIEI